MRLSPQIFLFASLCLSLSLLFSSLLSLSSVLFSLCFSAQVNLSCVALSHVRWSQSVCACNVFTLSLSCEKITRKPTFLGAAEEKRISLSLKEFFRLTFNSPMPIDCPMIIHSFLPSLPLFHSLLPFYLSLSTPPLDFSHPSTLYIIEDTQALATARGNVEKRFGESVMRERECVCV
jgi:hypothetical protein